MSAIKKSSLVDQVYQKLRTEIIMLKRPMGSKLNVNDLQEELGVSCTPIREAINRLQQEGLVIYENNVGAHVLLLREHDVLEIQQLAVTLHCAAARLAMENGDRKLIAAELEKHLMDYKTARNIQSEVMAINRFLGTFYHNCGNQRLDKSMISRQGQQLLLRYIYAGCIPERGKLKDDYQRMLDAVLRGDTESLCTAIRENADKATPVLLEFVSQYQVPDSGEERASGRDRSRRRSG
jgi:DNA-binding GntR family transcriptional regulator